MPKTRDELIRERTEAEMQRGAQKIVGHILSAAFNPDHVPDEDENESDYKVSPQERARRDEYIRQMKIGRGEDPDAAD